MGDLADFEQLSALERRLSQALDRISASVAAGKGADVAAGAGADMAMAQAEAEAARQDAEARATEAAERVTALEARLAETQDALSEAQSEVASARAEAAAARTEAETARVHAAQTPGTDAATLAALEQRLAASEAAHGMAQAELAERANELTEKDAALAEMQSALEAAQSTATAGLEDTKPEAEPEDMEKALAVMGRRVERARVERDQARAACDAATDTLDEIKEATGASVDARILSLRHHLRLMRGRAEDLAAQVSLLQSGAGVDASVLDQGLLAEVETLRQLRETDAAELDRIVQEMQAGLDMAIPELADGGSNA